MGEQNENEVFLSDDGIVRIIYHGNQTKPLLQRAIRQATILMRQLAKEGGRVLVLADIRDMGTHTEGARMIGVQARSTMPFWKMAIITSELDPHTANISKMISAMSGRSKEIGYFLSDAEAISWFEIDQ